MLDLSTVDEDRIMEMTSRAGSMIEALTLRLHDPTRSSQVLYDYMKQDFFRLRVDEKSISLLYAYLVNNPMQTAHQRYLADVMLG